MPTNKLTCPMAAGLFAALSVCAVNAAEPTPTPLAQLSGVSGDVLVDQGEALSPAVDGMTLSPFDRVMVPDQGSVTLVYREGCRDELAGPAMRTVTTEAACVAAQAAASPEAVALQQVATSQGAETAGLAILGVAAAGGVIWAATEDDDDDDGRALSQAPAPETDTAPVRLSP